MQLDDELKAEKVHVVWIEETDPFWEPGTADGCRRFVRGWAPEAGTCTGGGDLNREHPAFAEHSVAAVVRLSDMRVQYLRSFYTDETPHRAGAEILVWLRTH